MPSDTLLSGRVLSAHGPLPVGDVNSSKNTGIIIVPGTGACLYRVACITPNWGTKRHSIPSTEIPLQWGTAHGVQKGEWQCKCKWEWDHVSWVGMGDPQGPSSQMDVHGEDAGHVYHQRSSISYASRKATEALGMQTQHGQWQTKFDEATLFALISASQSCITCTTLRF